MATQTQELAFEARDETHAVGVSGHFTMQTRHEIPALWNRFFRSGAVIENQAEEAMLGISYNADGTGAFDYGVAIAVTRLPETLPEGFCTMSLTAGRYAVLRAFGPVTELPTQFDRMFGELLPNSGATQREGAVFERYPPDTRNGPEGMAYEIWVPVTTD